MSQLEVDKIVPQSGTTLTIGDSGDTITISAGATLSGSLNADNLTSGTVPDARITGAYTGITNLTMSGDLTVDTDTLFVDSTNNRVGIGTASPSAELHVVDTSSAGTIISEGNIGQITLRDNNGGTDSKVATIRSVTANTVFGTQNDSFGAFSEKMRIDSSGNVGIGTSSPSATLSVDSGSTALNSNFNSTNAYVRFQNSGTSIGDIGAGASVVSGGTAGDFAIASRSGNLDFGTGSVRRMRIDSSGRVGIGVTNLNRNLAIGTLGTKTNTSSKYVMNIGQTSEASSYAGLGVYYVGASSASNRKWQFQPTENGVANDGIIEFNTNGGRFKAVNGIQLGGDTDANKLDDYEEGSFTAEFSSGGATFTYSVRQGYYTKIGNIVIYNIYIQLDGTPFTTTSNAVTITGLPFTSTSSSVYQSSSIAATRYVSFDSNFTSLEGRIGPNTTSIILLENGGGQASNALRSNQLSNSSGQIFISGSYRANA